MIQIRLNHKTIESGWHRRLTCKQLDTYIKNNYCVDIDIKISNIKWF